MATAKEEDGPSKAERPGAQVLGIFVDASTADGACESIVGWGWARESRAVYFCNVHSLVTAQTDRVLSSALARGDLLTPDGMPVAWMLRRSGIREQRRVCGPDLMPRLLTAAEQMGLSVFFYGDEQATLETLRQTLYRDHPNLAIAGMISPPFRPLTAEEDHEYVEAINGSGAHLVFVSLGCPKQEKWIADHLGRVQATMLGVGAAFSFLAGIKPRAPRWMQLTGLEWLHRLASEPRRLARRYLVTNTEFAIYLLREAMRDFWTLSRDPGVGGNRSKA